jgi:chromosome segregation ATPase
MNQMNVESMADELDETKKKLRELKDTYSKTKSNLSNTRELLRKAEHVINGGAAEIDNTRIAVIDILQSINYAAKNRIDHGKIMITAVNLIEYDKFFREHKLSPVSKIVEAIAFAAQSQSNFEQTTLKYRG